ncbi:cytotoxic and regulatory T-cell molecule [Synchiropus splendidus]|uniref:cytotoxic and regulatory T-cell molecule n=1 Tax=Synchiropus splendidus TaxID=270530 RepID=UPI00237D7189|nr:cytotoxic and regulatory T-cell molecule [Synchiropus splendidus]
MEVKLQRCVLLLLIQGSVAAFQRQTVWKGQTVTFSCPGTKVDGSTLEWTDPRGVKMFDHSHALTNPRYTIIERSKNKFAFTISDVNFKDGGNYTCSRHSSCLKRKVVEVVVLGKPKMRITRVGGKTYVHCSAEGSHQPPHISWKFNSGPEFSGSHQVTRRGKKYVSTDVLRVKATNRASELRCFAQHPSLPSQTVMDSVTVVRKPSKAAARSQTRTTSDATTAKMDSTATELTSLPPEVSSNSPPLSTTHDFPTTSLNANYPVETFTSFLFSTRPAFASTLPVTENNSTGANATDETFVSETTHGIMSNVTGQANDTDSHNNQQKYVEASNNSSLLIFLVTCLILALLVTVIFIAVKLRRAHITWKKDNEVSDPSEESSKSKTSQEEKNSQNIRQKGPYNTPFTLYRVESPSAPAETEMTETEEEDQAVTNTPPSTKADVKETEL